MSSKYEFHSIPPIFERNHGGQFGNGVNTVSVAELIVGFLYECVYFFIGNFVEFSYKEIKPSGQERTAAEWDYVAEATRRRRRILQSRILS